MKKKANIRGCISGDTLDLSMADLQEVPVKEIAAYPKITHLDVSSNNILQLSEYFPLCLVHITKLDLNHNKLTSLPDNFGCLVNLRYLDLSQNGLTTVPLSFGSLKALNWLDLSDNPLVPKVGEIVGVCVNSSDCQAAAKRLVSFMDQVNKRVLVEKERMRKAKQTEAEQAELELLKRKEKKEKKKKKKLLKLMENANGTTEMTDTDTDEFKQRLHSHSGSAALPARKSSLVWRVLVALLRLCVYGVVLGAAGACAGWYLLDETTAKQLRAAAQDMVATTTQRLPAGAVATCRSVLATCRSLSSAYGSRLADLGRGGVALCTDWYARLSADQTVQLYVDSLCHLFHVLTEVSATLCSNVVGWVQS